MWRHGGTVHGPVPRDYCYKTAAQEKKNALRRRSRARSRTGELVVVDDFDVDEPQDQERWRERLASSASSGKALLVDNCENANLALASRNNLKRDAASTRCEVNVYDVGQQRARRAQRGRAAASDGGARNNERPARSSAARSSPRRTMLREGRRTSSRSKWTRDANKIQVKQRGRELVQGEGRRSPDRQRRRQAAAGRAGSSGTRPDWKKAYVRLKPRARSRSSSSRGCKHDADQDSTNRQRPTRRFQTSSHVEEITKKTPEKSLIEGKHEDRRPQQPRPAHLAVHRRRPQAGVPRSSTSSATSTASRPRSRRSSTIPNRSARIALLNYADGEKRYILAPDGLKVGATVMSGPRRRHPGRQRAAAAEHPARHDGSQHRAEARQGRPDGALGRRAGAADGARRRLGARSSCPRAKCAGCTSSASRRSARSATSSTRTSRSARRGAPAGWAEAAQPRRRR